MKRTIIWFLADVFFMGGALFFSFACLHNSMFGPNPIYGPDLDPIPYIPPTFAEHLSVWVFKITPLNIGLYIAVIYGLARCVLGRRIGDRAGEYMFPAAVSLLLLFCFSAFIIFGYWLQKTAV